MTQRKSSNQLIEILTMLQAFLASVFLVKCTQVLDLNLCILMIKIVFSIRIDYSVHLLFVTVAK